MKATEANAYKIVGVYAEKKKTRIGETRMKRK